MTRWFHNWQVVEADWPNLAYFMCRNCGARSKSTDRQGYCLGTLPRIAQAEAAMANDPDMGSEVEK